MDCGTTTTKYLVLHALGAVMRLMTTVLQAVFVTIANGVWCRTASYIHAPQTKIVDMDASAISPVPATDPFVSLTPNHDSFGCYFLGGE